MIPISESTLGAESMSAEADAESGLSSSAWGGANNGATTRAVTGGFRAGGVSGCDGAPSPTSGSVLADAPPPDLLSTSTSTFSFTIPSSLSAPSLLQTCLGLTLPGSSSFGQGIGMGALLCADVAGLMGVPGAGRQVAAGGCAAGGGGKRASGCGMTRTVTLTIPHTFTRCATVRWGPTGLATWRLRFVRCASSLITYS